MQELSSSLQYPDLSFMPKKILVTGGSGFVGKQILKALDAEDVELVLPVRTGKEAFFDYLNNTYTTIQSHDIFSESEHWWQETCKDIDILIHAAWYVEPGKYLSSPKNLDCLTGSLTMAKGAIKAGVKRIVGIGTCFEYDLSPGVLSIHTPIAPTTLYAAAKASLYFNLANWLSEEEGVTFAWCRLFYLYGEIEQANRLVPYIRQQIEKGEDVLLTSGKQIRDYLDVAVAGKKIAEIALSEKIGPANICSGTPTTVRQLTEKIADEYGRRDLLKFGARPDNLVDPPCVLGVPD